MKISKKQKAIEAISASLLILYESDELSNATYHFLLSYTKELIEGL